MLFSKTATSWLALFGAANAAAISQKRATAVELYAYGTGISGLQVYFGDNLAYLGNPEPIKVPRISNLTFTTTSNEQVSVSSASGQWSADNNPVLYINPNGFSQAGFVFSNDTTYDNQTTTGFSWYGTDLGWYTADWDFQLLFWAVETSVDGLYKLYWNPDSATYTTGTAVVLKSN